MPVPAVPSRPARAAREVLLGAALGAGPDRTADADVVRTAVAGSVRDLALRLAADAAELSWLQRWQTLAALGRTDLVVGRLVEGHLDAVAILAEAGREPAPGALYGVWASASGGTGLRLSPAVKGLRLDGAMRFCSGADTVDRALVTATDSDEQQRLVDTRVDRRRMVADRASWPAVGMDASDSYDIAVAAMPVKVDDLVGPPGFYGERAGLPLGGIGVAAVWLGGAQGLLDATLRLLTRFGADDHQLAHVGAVTAALESAAATLVATASLLDGGLTGARSAAAPIGSAAADIAVLHRVALTCRSVVEAAVATAVQRLPRVAGPVALSRDGAYAHRLADLEVYVRQHHAERDLARLGAAELTDPWSTASGSGGPNADHRSYAPLDRSQPMTDDTPRADGRLSAPPRLDEAAGHFEAAYEADDDPWAVQTSWYERRKRAVLMASLPREHYRAVWEPACSIGAITIELAARCDQLKASDVSSRAVAAAQAATCELEHVRVALARLPDDPPPYGPGECDLVVLSEVLYYLDAPHRAATIELARRLLAPGGDLVVVHWREHPFDSHVSGEQGNREVVDAFGTHVLHHLDDGFVLDVVQAD